MKDNVSEYNSIPKDELNTTNIDELNRNTRAMSITKSKERLAKRKLLSTFLVACSIVAMAQSTFTIPIFSTIFNPSTTEVIETDTTTPPSTPDIIIKPHIADIHIVKDYSSDLENKAFLIQAMPDESFTNYESLFYELVDEDGNIMKDDYGNQINYAIIPQTNISTFWARFDIKKTVPEKYYGLNIYCSTSDTTNLHYTKTKVKDETTYYLIYQHPTKIMI